MLQCCGRAIENWKPRVWQSFNVEKERKNLSLPLSSLPRSPALRSDSQSECDAPSYVLRVMLGDMQGLTTPRSFLEEKLAASEMCTACVRKKC
eukprot:1146584-Pelagomonas_calceolata.AAC.3